MALEGRAKRVRIYVNEGDRVGDQTAATAVLAFLRRRERRRGRRLQGRRGLRRARRDPCRATGGHWPGAPDGHRVDRLGGARRPPPAPGEGARPARAHHRRSDRGRPLRALSCPPCLERADRGGRHVPRRRQRGSEYVGPAGRGAAPRAGLPSSPRRRREGSGRDHHQLRSGHPRWPHRPDGAVTEPGGTGAPRRARAPRPAAEDRRRDHDPAPGHRACHDAPRRGRPDHGSAPSQAAASGGPGRWTGRSRQPHRPAPHGRRGRSRAASPSPSRSG